jgi:hypothetical protein
MGHKGQHPASKGEMKVHDFSLFELFFSFGANQLMFPSKMVSVM